jgi:hypothetical protein
MIKAAVTVEFRLRENNTGSFPLGCLDVIADYQLYDNKSLGLWPSTLRCRRSKHAWGW